MRRIWSNAKGATSVQYGLASGIVALGIVAGLTATKMTLSALYRRMAVNMSAAVSQIFGSPYESKGTGVRQYNQYAVNGRTQWENDVVTFPDGSTASRMRTFNADGTDPGNTLVGAYSYGFTDAKTGLGYSFNTASDGSISVISRNATMAVDGFNGTITFNTNQPTMSYYDSSTGARGNMAVSQAIQTLVTNALPDRQYIDNQVMQGGFTPAPTPSSAM
jgi:Flp pilus assembly pilin Flp